MIRMTYPENRMVTEETVISWAKDSLVNSVIEHKRYKSDTDFESDLNSIQSSNEYRNMNLDSAVTLLDDSGECSFNYRVPSWNWKSMAE